MTVSPSVKRTHFFLVGLGALVPFLPQTISAIEIGGVVKSKTAKYATVVTKSKSLPAPGDKALIYFKMPGSDIEVSVANGHVYEITGPNIMVQIDKSTGVVAKDQLVRFNPSNQKNSQTASTKPTAATPQSKVVASAALSPPSSPTPPAAAAQTPHMPVANSADMHEIGDAMRNFIIGRYIKERLPQAFTFKIDHILVTDRFANIEAVPVFQDGSKLVPRYMPDIGYNFCLVKTKFGWNLAVDLSRSDVPDQTQIGQIRARLPSGFPTDVFSPTWRKLLGPTN